MPTLARLTPHRFHQFVNRLRGRAEADAFPTRYRANTYSTVQRLAAASGFTVQKLDRIEGRPEYLLGAACERRANAWNGLAGPETGGSQYPLGG